MSWNYRMVYEERQKGEGMWSIREVYYDDDGSIHSWEANPGPLEALTYCDLCDLHLMFQRAFDKPHLIIEGDQIYEFRGEVLDDRPGA